jgi:hypothetical protein
VIRQAPLTRQRHYCECDSCRAWFPARPNGLPYFEREVLRADALEAGWRFRDPESEHCMCPACVLAWTGQPAKMPPRSLAGPDRAVRPPRAAIASGTARPARTA